MVLGSLYGQLPRSLSGLLQKSRLLKVLKRKLMPLPLLPGDIDEFFLVSQHVPLIEDVDRREP